MLRVRLASARLLVALAAGLSMALTAIFALPAQAITGGSSVGISQYPYMVRIDFTHGTTIEHCDGALISDRWILTAAHCVIDDGTGNKATPSEIKVSVGVDQPYWAGNQLAVNRVERHPNYPAALLVGSNRSWPADFALVQLAKSVSEPTIALAAVEPAVGSDVTFVGWGCTMVNLAGCTNTPQALQMRTSTVKDDTRDCQYTGAYAAFDLCTARSGPISVVRPGDSGGPMLKSTPTGVRLAGVISGSNAGYDSVGSVPYVLGWIHDVTGIGAPAESTPAAPPVVQPPASTGQTTYSYQVYHTCANGACGLRFHAGPGYSNYGVTRTLLDGTTIGIVCQTRGEAVSGADGSSSTIWDKTTAGDYAADFYINTPGMTGNFSPPIPQC